MNNISNFVNNLFYGYPKTEENARLKSQILDSLQSKYQTYVSQGMSEDSAFGRVVAEFGDISELMPDSPATQSTSNIPNEPSPRLQAYMDEFQAYLGKFRLNIAIGVLLCIAGVFGSGAIADYDNTALTTATFIIPVAIGVFIFIISGIKYENLKKMILALSQKENYSPYYQYFKDSDILVHEISQSTKGFNNNFPFGNSYLVSKLNSVIMIIATIIFLILGFVYNTWHPSWVVFVVGGLLCGIVSILFSGKNN